MVACAALVWSTAARAQAIEVANADDCITEQSLSAAMAEYRDRVAPDPMLHARVRVAGEGASFELLLESAVLAEREFDSLPQRCADRVRAVAIALALAFESTQAREREAAARPTATPISAPDTPAEPIEDEPTAAEDADAEPLEQAEVEDAEDEPLEPATTATPSPFALYGGGGALIGVLPEPALLLSLGGTLALGTALQLDLAALASPGITHELAGGLVDAQLFGGQGALCLRTQLASLRVAGCAGVAAAAVPARGRGFAVRDRRVLTGWLALLLGATVEQTLAGPISARVFAGLYGSVVQPSLEAKVDDARRDATPWPIAGVLALHVLWVLP